MGFSRRWRYQRCAVFALMMAVTAASAGVQTVKTGVASPQGDSELGNIELLRERAIRNAMELALAEVRGTTVSAERSVTARSRSEVQVRDGRGTDDVGQDIRQGNRALVRTEGHVRVLEILNEWEEDGRYYVTVRLDVLDAAEANKQLGAGFYWQRIGKPGVSVLLKTTQGQHASNTDPYTLRYIRDVLGKNGIPTPHHAERGARYVVEVTQEVNTRFFQRFATYAADCRISYRVIDRQTQQSLVEDRKSYGPQGGFSDDAVAHDCLAQITPGLSAQLVRALASVFNDQWHQGDDFVLQIAELPGSQLPVAMETISQAFRLKEGRMDRYAEQVLAVTVRYQGDNTALLNAVMTAFDDAGHAVVPQHVEVNKIRFRWIARDDRRTSKWE